MIQKKHVSPDHDWTERPLFRIDQKLTPQRLNRIHEHHARRLRHAMLGLAGPGVVYGYKLDTDDKGRCNVKNGGIQIGCGLAIDCYGRQLYWPGGRIRVSDLGGDKPECTCDPTDFTLWVHYAERRAAGDDRCDCAEEEVDWIQEGVVFTLSLGCKKVPCDACPDHCDTCVGVCDYTCGRLGADDVVIPADEHLGKLCRDPREPCHAACDHWLYDADAGLPLACVSVCEKTAGPKDCPSECEFCPEEPKVCEYRPYVYRNPLLYELIRGCHTDFASVAELSFESLLKSDWYKTVHWDDFVREICDGMSVCFTKPIAIRTLHPASVFVTAIVQEPNSYFRDVLRIPVQRMVPLEEKDDYATGVRLEFSEDWKDIQLKKEVSRFNCGAVIEFTVRGAMLRDQCGCMLDSRPLDYRQKDDKDKCAEEPPCRDKIGQSMLGDDFVVTFCVDRKPSSEQRYPEPQQPTY